MLVVVAQGRTEVEAQMICGRLETAGIEASYRRSTDAIPQIGAGVEHSVYVDSNAVEHARAVIEDAEAPFSDEELATLAEEAGPPPEV
ncbi:MAG TPA: hypothetical protein VHX66_08505 [Solirubrobacteraceae bacterium]|jgi:hypothetical protein|nr:hypothetical protein [Solirubrobacteraceae bacterium]